MDSRVGQPSLISRHLSIKQYKPVDTQLTSVASLLLHNDFITIACTSKKFNYQAYEQTYTNVIWNELTTIELYKKCCLKRLDNTHMQRSLVPELSGTFSPCHFTIVSHGLLTEERSIPSRKNNNFSMVRRHRRHVVAPRWKARDASRWLFPETSTRLRAFLERLTFSRKLETNSHHHATDKYKTSHPLGNLFVAISDRVTHADTLWAGNTHRMRTSRSDGSIKGSPSEFPVGSSHPPPTPPPASPP